MSLIEQLKQRLPDGVISDEADLMSSHQSDWSGSDPQHPIAVARPQTTEQVSTILAFCNDHGQAVVTQGGLTGLSGGATPKKGELALSLERLRGIIDIDEKGMCMTVKAGTPLEQIQQAAIDAGLFLPLDLGARGSCSIGGNIATNAGGNQVIKYGMTRSLVLGIEAVQADGTVIRAMNKMLKNNAGYDLKHLFIGSEGTLGVVTECVLRLYPKPKTELTALCTCANFDSVIKLLKNSQSALGALSAFEVMWHSYFKYATTKVDNVRDPFTEKHEFYVLLELESSGSEHAEDEFLQVLSQQIEQGVVDDVLIAQSKREASDFWSIRDAIGEIIPMLVPFANFDIGVPIKHMHSFITELEAKLRAEYDNLTFIVFGHVGDGNLHIGAATGIYEHKDEIYAKTYELAAKYDATVTAEHGVGTQKKQYLKYCRSDAEIALMQILKNALDPNNILNPGRIIDADS